VQQLKKLIYRITLLIILFKPIIAVSLEGIYGKVYDSCDNNPLSNVNITIAGSSFKDSTNENGDYDIDYVPGSIKLQYSKIGYLPYILKLDIAQKLPYPAQDVRLLKLPIPINWVGEIIQGATISVSTRYDLSSEQLDFNSTTDDNGHYILPFFEEPAYVIISAKGYKTTKYEINISSQKVPKEQKILLLPETPGLYLVKDKLISCNIIFDKKKMASTGGYVDTNNNLVIARILGSWEGKYYAKGQINKIESKKDYIEFYYYPDIPVNLVGRAFPLSDNIGVNVLKLGPEGLLATGGPQSIKCEKVPFNPIPIVDQEQQNFLLFERNTLILLRIPLNFSGQIAICDWIQEYGSLYRPGKLAWIIDTGSSKKDINLLNDGLEDNGVLELKPGSNRKFDEIEFVWIPPGTFEMGSRYSAKEIVNLLNEKSKNKVHFSNRQPQHTVKISKGFWIGKYEITKEQWLSVMGTKPWSGNEYVLEDPQTPAVCIDWEDSQQFIISLNEGGEGKFRLPTEAEWEYACRAGSNTLFCFGDNVFLIDEYAWYDNNTQKKNEHYAHPVGLKKPNAWGIYDMHGNVWEWCQDWYDDDYYKKCPNIDPQGPSKSYSRTMRGGSWISTPGFCCSASRSYATTFRDLIGFRICRDE